MENTNVAPPHSESTAFASRSTPSAEMSGQMKNWANLGGGAAGEQGRLVGLLWAESSTGPHLSRAGLQGARVGLITKIAKITKTLLIKILLVGVGWNASRHESRPPHAGLGHAHEGSPGARRGPGCHAPP